MSCRRFASHLARQTQPLDGAFRGVGYWLHWLICPFCRQYRRELKLLRSEAAKRTPAPLSAADIDGVKDRLRARLRREAP